MQVKILNKNLTTENDYSTAKTFAIDEGSVLRMCKNETLDSGTIIINNLTLPLEIEPLDRVYLTDESSRFSFLPRYMLVDDFIETIVCLNPLIYRYDIKLMSETKLLETIVCPSLKITKLFNQTPRTIYDYLKRYNNMFGGQIRVVDPTESISYVFTNKFVFSTRLIEKFQNIECPEMQWNEPTLREVFNDLMMVKDCIPVLQNGVIDYLDLSEVKNDISTNPRINYITRSQSSTDYISKLRINLRNALQTNKDGIINSSFTENISFNSEDYYQTTDNVIIKTQHPIYKLKHLYFCWVGADIGTSQSASTIAFTTYKYDLCNVDGTFTQNSTNEKISYVSEQQEYQAKKIAYKQEDLPSAANYIERAGYQNTTFYYTRGSNEIKGFTNLTKVGWTGILPDTTALQYLITSIAYYWENDNITGSYDCPIASGSGRIPQTTPFFQVEYESIGNCLVEVSKGLKPSNDRVVTDNQTNSYIDSYSQGFLEYQKANRLGNLELRINARLIGSDYSTYNIEVGDYYKDSVIYQCEYQLYKGHVEINALATKDYVLRNYFTGVKAKIRSWKILDGNEALIRHELNQAYLEFSYKVKTEEIKGKWLNTITYFCSPLLASNTIAPIKHCAVRTTTDNGDHYPSSTNQRYEVGLIVREIGNSITFTFGFEDNYQVGYGYLLDTTHINVYTGGTKQQEYIYLDRSTFTVGVPSNPYRYVDDNGEMVDLVYDLYTQDAITTQETGLTADYSKQLIVDTYSKPLIGTTYQQITNNVKLSLNSGIIDKDNAEVLMLTTQIEFCSDTNDIVFTRKFLDRQECIRNKAINSLAVHLGYKSHFDFRNIENSSKTIASFPSITKVERDNAYGETARITILVELPQQPSDIVQARAMAKGLLKNNVIYLLDGNDIVMGIVNKNVNAVLENGTYYATSIIYLNYLRIRDYNVYVSQSNQQIARKI